jgi:hypothetical protein
MMPSRKNSIERNTYYNEKWLQRDAKTIEQRKHNHSVKWSKGFNGKSPELEFDNDEITFKRPSKYGS